MFTLREIRSPWLVYHPGGLLAGVHSHNPALDLGATFSGITGQSLKNQLARQFYKASHTVKPTYNPELLQPACYTVLNIVLVSPGMLEKGPQSCCPDPETALLVLCFQFSQMPASENPAQPK